METKMSILFYGKKTKSECDKLLSVYLRVTINGKRFEVSTQRYIEPYKWSPVAAKAKGNSEEARSINTHLDMLKNKVYDYQQLIQQEGGSFTRDALYQKWYGIKDRSYHLVEVFKHHNDQLQALIGKGFSKETFGKYRTTADPAFRFEMEIPRSLILKAH